MKSVYIGKQEEEFDKRFAMLEEKKIQRVLDLKDCKNHDDLVVKMLNAGMTKDTYGKCFNSLKDALGDDGYFGFNAFYKIKNWDEYYLTNSEDAAILLHIIFATSIEMKELKNKDYVIYLDDLPDFSHPEIKMFAHLLSE